MPGVHDGSAPRLLAPVSSVGWCDGADWTEMDIDDLKAAIESGRSMEEAAEFLCRADSVDDVARKCEELGLKPKARS